MAKHNHGYGFSGELELVRDENTGHLTGIYITEVKKDSTNTYELVAYLNEFVGRGRSVSINIKEDTEPKPVKFEEEVDEDFDDE